jgi:rhodanese-related sulfurtransferase
LIAFAQTQAQALQIDPQDFASWRSSGVAHCVLDVREPWELDLCRFEDSLDIPTGQVPEALDRLGKGALADAPLVVVCHHGVRSLQVVSWLRKQGVANAINLRGGIDLWAQHIDPTMRRY